MVRFGLEDHPSHCTQDRSKLQEGRAYVDTSQEGRGPKACKEDRGKASLIAADSEDIFGPRADAQPQDSLKGIAPNTLSKIFS